MTSEIIRSHWFTYKSHEADSAQFQPRVISSYDEIPTGFLAAFPGGDEGFPYTVLIPAADASLFQESPNPQMLCLYKDRLVNLEALQDGVETHEYALKSITSVEHGRVLLNSWLTIHSASRHKTFNFTSTVDQVFSPMIKAIRGTSGEHETEDSAAQTREEATKLGYLWKLNIKYFNYAKQSLAPGATIRASVYQGDIPLSKLNFFKKPVFSSHLSGHLAMLTDRELVFIKESEEIREIHDTSYGGVFSYIPLEKIKSVAFESNNDKKVDCLMNIQLVDGKYYQFQFSTATAVQLDAFKDACAQTFATA
jgi:hypothetical protein